jgi:hypothetical protein
MAAVDRPSAEDVEQPRATDAPPPPPPPDSPGAGGYPSRAESKAFAAAAADRSDRRVDADAPDTSSVSDADADELGAPRTDGTEQSETLDGDDPATREDGASDALDDTELGLHDDGPEQPSNPEEVTAADDGDHTSVDTAAQTDAADHRGLFGGDADTAEQAAPVETAGDQRPGDLDPPSDHPAVHSELLSAEVESSTDTGADGADRSPDVEQEAEPPGEPDARDQQGEYEPPVDASDNRDSAEPSDASGQTAEVDESTSDTDADLGSGSDESDKGSSVDGSGPAGEPGGEAPKTTEGDRAPDFDFTMDDGTRVLAYLDRDDESDELEKPGSPPDPPSGEELLEMEDDELSQPEQFRRMFYKNVEDTHDVVTKGAKASQDMLGPKPTGQAEIQIPEGGAVMIDAQHATVDAGSSAGAALVVGVVSAELIRWSSRKIPEWIGDNRARS